MENISTKMKSSTCKEETLLLYPLKIVWKILCSVKRYDTSNMNVFTISLWENCQWCLIYFDLLIYTHLPPKLHLIGLGHISKKLGQLYVLFSGCTHCIVIRLWLGLVMRKSDQKVK